MSTITDVTDSQPYAPEDFAQKLIMWGLCDLQMEIVFQGLKLTKAPDEEPFGWSSCRVLEMGA